jgi:hypothetical protein
MARTNLSVDRKVFEEFSAQADKRNMTLYAFANESLSAISRISAEGGDPEGLYQVWKVLSVMKEVDAIVFPSDIVEELVVQLYRIDKKRLLARFSELGTSLVALLRIVAEDLQGLISLAKGLFSFIPVKHMEVLTLENGSIEVNLVGAGKGIETTECSSEFLKSVLYGYGYNVTREEIHPGVIRLWAETKSKNNLVREALPGQV